MVIMLFSLFLKPGLLTAGHGAESQVGHISNRPALVFFVACVNEDGRRTWTQLEE